MSPPRGPSCPISIVMPVYNEASVIADVISEMTSEVTSHIDGAEIVVVNDASTDGTAQILDRIAATHGQIRVYHAATNRGHGPAVRRAIDESAGEWIFQVDSDGQLLASDFWRLWPLRDRADLVVGERQTLRNGRHRVVVSSAARYVSRLLGGANVRDVNAPFKLISRNLWNDLAPSVPATPLTPSLLIAFGAGIRGWRIEQIPIRSLPRRHGQSSVDLWKLIRLSAGALRELATFRIRLARRAAVPPAIPDTNEAFQGRASTPRVTARH